MDDSRQSFSLNMDGSSLADDMLEIIQEKPNITFNNITVTGNLEVDGEEIINEVETFKVKDAIVEFNNATPAVNADTGFTAKENIAGNTRYKGLIFKSGQDVGIVYNNASTEPLTTLEQPYDLGTVRVRDANSQNEPITKQQFDNNTVKLSGNQNISGVKTFNTDTHLHKAKFINPSTQDTDRAIYSDENGDLVYLNGSSTGDHTFYTMQGGTETLMLRINAQTNQIDCLKGLSMNNNRLVSVGAPSLPGDAATKQYVDDNAPTDYVNLTTNQTVGGEKTFTDKMILKNTSAGMQSLLRLETERPWEFRTNNTGAGTALELYSTSSEKGFKITTNTNTGGDQDIAQFSETSVAIYTQLNLNDNDIQDIDKAEIKEIELLQGANGNKAGSIGADGLNNILYTNSVVDKEHRFYVRDSGVNSGILFIGPETITARRDITMALNSSIKDANDVQTDKLTLIRPDGSTSAGYFELTNSALNYYNMSGGTSSQHNFYNNVIGNPSLSLSILNNEIRGYRTLHMMAGNIDMNTNGQILSCADVQSRKMTLLRSDDGTNNYIETQTATNNMRYVNGSGDNKHSFFNNSGGTIVNTFNINHNNVQSLIPFNMSNNIIYGLATPVDADDAATKGYVDGLVGSSVALGANNTFTGNNEMRNVGKVGTLPLSGAGLDNRGVLNIFNTSPTKTSTAANPSPPSTVLSLQRSGQGGVINEAVLDIALSTNNQAGNTGVQSKSVASLYLNGDFSGDDSKKVLELNNEGQVQVYGNINMNGFDLTGIAPIRPYILNVTKVGNIPSGSSNLEIQQYYSSNDLNFLPNGNYKVKIRVLEYHTNTTLQPQPVRLFLNPTPITDSRNYSRQKSDIINGYDEVLLDTSVYPSYPNETVGVDYIRCYTNQTIETEINKGALTDLELIVLYVKESQIHTGVTINRNLYYNMRMEFTFTRLN